MTFSEIKQHLLSGDSVCQRYRGLAASASSKSALAEIISDSNGVEFLTQRISTDVEMDYADVARVLGSHVNGKRVFQHDGYTSEIYCGYSGEIEARSTLLAVWGSDVDIYVPAGTMLEIDCDSRSSCTIFLEEGAFASCVHWGAKPAVKEGSLGMIKFVDKSNH